MKSPQPKWSTSDPQSNDTLSQSRRRRSWNSTRPDLDPALYLVPSCPQLRKGFEQAHLPLTVTLGLDKNAQQAIRDFATAVSQPFDTVKDEFETVSITFLDWSIFGEFPNNEQERQCVFSPTKTFGACLFDYMREPASYTNEEGLVTGYDNLLADIAIYGICRYLSGVEIVGAEYYSATALNHTQECCERSHFWAFSDLFYLGTRAVRKNAGCRAFGYDLVTKICLIYFQAEIDKADSEGLKTIAHANKVAGFVLHGPFA